MHTPLIEDHAAPERRAELEPIVTDELLAPLQAEPGYTGALNVPDHASGNELTIVLWQTEAQARRALAEHGPAFLTARRRLVAASVRERDSAPVWSGGEITRASV
jgi:hypothetical protein